MRSTTRLKKPQVPEYEGSFDLLEGRPKYAGVEMTSATNIPSVEALQQHIDEAIIAEAAARGAADDDLQDAIDVVSGAVAQEVLDRESADVNLQEQIDAISASSDVKDIVGTKAELNNYDTSTLGDKDIIKVLQDESENNATTYYRWSTSTETFSLIGEEGPYYTKSATDALLNDKADKSTTYTKTEVDTALAGKQNTLTAGANIQISNDTISATDTTYSDFVGTDGTAAGTAGLVPAPATTDAGKVLGADGTWVTGGPTVVQTEGTSQTDVMSQNATTALKGMAKKLTSADYNWPTSSPDGIALWLLPAGMYYADMGTKCYNGSSSTFSDAYRLFLVGVKSEDSVIPSNPQMTSVFGFNGQANNINNNGPVAVMGYRISDNGNSRQFANFLSTQNIVDNLTSTYTNLPLSANQGKVLKGLIDALQTATQTASYTDQEFETLWENV